MCIRDRGTITLGATAALTASFAPAPVTGGQPLAVERSVDGLHWTSSGSLPTDATGGLVVSTAPTVTGWYRVRFEGGPDLPAATSYPVRVIVLSLIHISEPTRPY